MEANPTIKIGIGICTYNRRELLKTLILRVRETVKEKYDLFVADDGSTDDTVPMLQRMKIEYESGKHDGIAWNKNKIINRFKEYDYLFILEDDLLILKEGWVSHFIEASKVSGYNWIGFLQGGLYGTKHSMEQFGEYHFEQRQYDGDVIRFLTKKTIQVCGGYNPMFRGAGWEHGEYSFRIRSTALNKGAKGELSLISAQQYLSIRNIPSTTRSKEGECNEGIVYDTQKSLQTYFPYDSQASIKLREAFINLYWYYEVRNVGDIIGPYLYNKLSGKYIRFCNSKEVDFVYFSAGSILDCVSNNSIVCGSGFISDNEYEIHPKEIKFVRGPMTRKKVLQSCNCPEIYGDPALLLPRFYNPKVNKKYKLGIIPHYCDKILFASVSLPEDIKVIDIQQAVEPFIDALLECECVVSSSLHGLIIADAYEIPNAYMQLSDNVYGGYFKYQDYFASIDREFFCLDARTGILSFENMIRETKTTKIEIALERLIQLCLVN